LYSFATKKLSRHLIVVFVAFSFLPFGVTILTSLVGAQSGFGFLREFLFADLLKKNEEGLKSHLKLQSNQLERFFSEASFELRLIASEAKDVLAHLEGYSGQPGQTFPSLDRETGMALTPKEAGVSIRVPAGVSITEDVRKKILALSALVDELKLIHERAGGLLAGVSILTPELEIVVPWHDFKKAVSKGLMTPDFVTFYDWQYAGYVRRLKEGEDLITPGYEDLWGAGQIISVCLPVVLRGKVQAIACADIHQNRLSSLLEPYPDVDVAMLLLDAKKHVVVSMGKLNEAERSLVRKIAGETDFTNATRGERDTRDTIAMWEQPHDTGLTLVGVVNKQKIASTLNPLSKRFNRVQALFRGSGLVLMIVLIAAIIYAAKGVRSGLKKTLNAFISPLQAVAGGKLEARVDYSGYEELEFIARTINQTIDALKEGRADLERSQKELEGQNQQLKGFIETIEAQRATIEQLSTPVIPVIRQTVLVPVVGVFDSMRAHQLSEMLLEAVKKERVKHVVFDMTGCGMIDTHTLKALTDVMRAVRILGARVYAVGFQPQIVKSLVGLGIELEGVSIDSTLDQTILKIQRMLGDIRH
jgi:anti-anti-sigma regulatory factor